MYSYLTQLEQPSKSLGNDITLLFLQHLNIFQ